MRQERLLKVLLSPHLSEKAAQANGASGCSRYVFKVVKSANKFDIKAAVEHLFKVTVKAVNITNVKGAASTKMGRSVGRYASWKKAYVVLEAGQEIHFA